MMKAYADDLREHVAALVLGTERPANAATRPTGRRQLRSLAAERDWLTERLASKPDLTLRALGRSARARCDDQLWFCVAVRA